MSSTMLCSPPRETVRGSHTPESSSQDSTRLLRRFAAERSTRDRDELVHRFLPLARSLARRYARAGEPLEDLEQVASLGLLKAIDRFDPERGYAFSSFAVPTILGELRRHFRDHAWVAHVPRAMQERTAALRRAIDELIAEEGRPPTVGRLAERLGCSDEDVVEAMSARASSERIPLDSSSDEEGSPSLADRLGDEDGGYELVDDRDALASILSILTEREREIVALRFFGGLSQTEIAGRIGVSQMQVSRVLRAALARLSLVAEHRTGLERPAAAMA